MGVGACFRPNGYSVGLKRQRSRTVGEIVCTRGRLDRRDRKHSLWRKKVRRGEALECVVSVEVCEAMAAIVVGWWLACLAWDEDEELREQQRKGAHLWTGGGQGSGGVRLGLR